MTVPLSCFALAFLLLASAFHSIGWRGASTAWLVAALVAVTVAAAPEDPETEEG